MMTDVLWVRRRAQQRRVTFAVIGCVLLLFVGVHARLRRERLAAMQSSSISQPSYPNAPSTASQPSSVTPPVTESQNTVANNPSSAPVTVTPPQSVPAAGAGSREPNYPAQAPGSVTGPVETSLLDSTRGKTIPLTVFYPTDGGDYPVIVFSHGAGGSPKDYYKLLTFWTSYGYVVVAPTHADSQSTFNDVRAALLSTTDADDRVNRVEDITFVVSCLGQLPDKVPGLAGKIDLTRIGVGGHSFGAYAAQLIGGADVDIRDDGNFASYRDPQVASVLMMSPQGVARTTLTENSWNSFTIPMMLMTGSLDFPLDPASSTRLDAYLHTPPGNKYEVYIYGANHLSFCDAMTGLEAFNGPQDGAGSGFSQAQIYDYVKSASLAFWDMTLKNNGSASAYLHSDDMSQTSGGMVKLSHG